MESDPLDKSKESQDMEDDVDQNNENNNEEQKEDFDGEGEEAQQNLDNLQSAEESIDENQEDAQEANENEEHSENEDMEEMIEEGVSPDKRKDPKRVQPDQLLETNSYEYEEEDDGMDDEDGTDYYSRTELLIKACIEGDESKVDDILSTHKDPALAALSLNKDSMSAIHHTLLNAQTSILEQFLKKDVFIESGVQLMSLSIFHLALAPSCFTDYKSKSIECFKLLMTHPNAQHLRFSSVDRLGRSALHIAAMNGIDEAITLLLKKGLDYKIKDKEGDMAVHYAIDFKQDNALDAMFNEVGSELILIEDGEGDNLICRSIKKHSWRCFALILKLGGAELLTLKNKDKLPSDIAKDCNFKKEFDQIVEAFTADETLANFDFDELENESSQNPSTLLVTSEECLTHAGFQCSKDKIEWKMNVPENPERVCLLIQKPFGVFLSDEFLEQLHWIDKPKKCPLTDLLRVHEYKYVRSIKSKCDKLDANKLNQIDRDTFFSKETYNVSLIAAGSVIDAVDHVMHGLAKNAFCAVRPPGHHAGPFGAVAPEDAPDVTSNGFCFFNNVAVGAAYLKCMYRSQIQKIAIVDFDVHHGNGTQAILEHLNPVEVEQDISLKFCKGTLSTCSYKPCAANTKNTDKIYPAGILNLPFDKNTTSTKWRAMYRDKVFPRLLEFNPDFIFLSAGFDAHEKDPLNADYALLDENDYKWLTENLVTIANTCCEGRIVSVLEGGYKITGNLISPFVQSVAAHVRALMHRNEQKFREDSKKKVLTNFDRLQEEKRKRKYTELTNGIEHEGEIEVLKSLMKRRKVEETTENGVVTIKKVEVIQKITKQENEEIEEVELLEETEMKEEQSSLAQPSIEKDAFQNQLEQIPYDADTTTDFDKPELQGSHSASNLDNENVVNLSNQTLEEEGEGEDNSDEEEDVEENDKELRKESEYNQEPNKDLDQQSNDELEELEEDDENLAPGNNEALSDATVINPIIDQEAKVAN